MTKFNMTKFNMTEYSQPRYSQFLLLQEGCLEGSELIVVHSGSCNTESVCARLNCNKAASCTSKAGGVVECSCPTCPPVYSPVCGTNNQTYHSQCELYRTVCLTDSSELELEYFGPCTSQPCSALACSSTPHSTCGPLNSCHCPACNNRFQPVCGDTGILYDNLCQLKREACRQKSYIARQPLPFCGEYSMTEYSLSEYNMTEYSLSEYNMFEYSLSEYSMIEYNKTLSTK